MNWINVKDRLPENGQCVLVIIYKENKYWEPFTCDYDGGFYDPMDDLSNEDWSDTVSHWMPLPEPPKQD